MATETGRQTEEPTATRPVWQSGAIAGVLGAVAFGAQDAGDCAGLPDWSGCGRFLGLSAGLGRHV